ncbi:MAG TPA: hypothetical protein VFJ84_03250 [Candidatus Saccharimonadales bacterium]|nr:hypothetical protein [Candidatus Saccharimonadales bacterium]
MSQEIPNIPDTADELIKNIDQAKEKQKSPAEIAAQINRVARKLVDRAEKHQDRIRRSGDGDTMGILYQKPSKGRDELLGIQLHMVRPTESGNEARDIIVRQGNKAEVRWTEEPQDTLYPSTYGDETKAVSAQYDKKLFRKGEGKLSTDSISDGEIVRGAQATPEDISGAAKVLSEVRGALSEKISEADTREAIRSLPESREHNN